MKVKKTGTEKMKAWYSFSSVGAKEVREEAEGGDAVEQQVGDSDLEWDITNNMLV